MTIASEHLQIGMSIVELDQPWEDSPFLLQGFTIKTDKELHLLREYCHWVVIQVTQRQARIIKALPEAIRVEMSKSPKKPKPKNNRRSNIDDYTSDIKQSQKAFKATRKMAISVFNAVRQNRQTNLMECVEVVEDVVKTVIHNTDALRFLTMIKHKDGYTAEHSVNVCILCAGFARHLGLSSSDIVAVALAGLLHDVGKSKVPLEILNKPGSFTEMEAAIMSEHTTYGYEILKNQFKTNKDAMDVAYSHHERYDGRGYPRNLRGEQIPYFGRLVCIVDAYDAMTSQRCYGQPKSNEKALRIILENARLQFDPKLASAFVKFIGLHATGSLTELNTGELAIIYQPNPHRFDRPIVLLVTDSSQNQLRYPVKLDLADAQHESISVIGQHPSGYKNIDVSDQIKQFLNQI